MNVDTSNCGDVAPPGPTTTTTSATTTTGDGGGGGGCQDDMSFCDGKTPGYYSHCDCKKYYQCSGVGHPTNILECPDGTLWNGVNCDWEANVDTSSCGTTDPGEGDYKKGSLETY